MLKQWLAHPLLRGLDVDDPRTTTVRRQIIQDNRFLRQIYRSGMPRWRPVCRMARATYWN